MRRRITRFLVTGMMILPACSESATTLDVVPQLSRGGPPTNIGVTTTVFDRDELGDLLLTRSDDQSAGQASYSAASAGVTSVIFASGDGWQLYLGNQQVRTLYLVLASQGIPAPDGYYYQNVEAFSRCFAANNTTGLSLLQMVEGQAYTNCSFGVDFKYGKKYKLAMSPQFAGTGRATVTCTATLDGSCRSWSVRPNTATSGTANLYEYAKNGSLVFKGSYQNTYSVTIDR